MTTYLTVPDILDVVHKLVEERLTAREPVPPARAVDLAKLEAALGAPQRTGGGSDLYPELADKTAILLYSMVKAHAWSNGNKRIGTVSTFLFLAENDKWWAANGNDIQAHVRWIATSEARCFQEVLAYLKKYFRMQLTEIPPDVL